MQAWAEGRAKMMNVLLKQNKMAKEKIAVVVSQFNHDITSKMKKKALQHAKKLGAEVVRTVEVPGAFEIPLAVSKVIADKNIAGIVTLGAVIKGETDHDVIITRSVAKKLLDLSIEFKKPISLGILGPNITWELADKKKEEYAARAVDAVVKMLRK